MAIVEHLEFPNVSGTGDRAGSAHVYYRHRYLGQIHPVPAGWRVSLYAESLGEFAEIEDAKRTVFEWIAMNLPAR